jgi:hypothetical protein
LDPNLTGDYKKHCNKDSTKSNFMTLAGRVRNEKFRTVACKRVLNLSNLEYSCPDPELSNTDPDPNQEYGSVSRLGFYLKFRKNSTI